MHPELQNLLNIGLKDGVLNEKERQILMRKADKLGVDIDEFEMELEGILSSYENNKAPAITPKSASSTKMTTCPNCGANISALSLNCEYCNYEIQHREANATIQQLFNKLKSVEQNTQKITDNPLKTLGRMSIDFFSGISRKEKILREKIEIINSFPIPNTKENMIEFLSLAVPRAKKVGNFFSSSNEENVAHNELVPAWEAKCKQIIIKCRFLFKGDHNTLQMIEKYAMQLDI